MKSTCRGPACGELVRKLAFVHGDVAALKDAGFFAPVKSQKREGKLVESGPEDARSELHQRKVRMMRKVTFRFEEKREDYQKLVSDQSLYRMC